VNNIVSAMSEPNRPTCSPEFLPLRPTPVFDAFWAFAAERQAIFLRRQYQAEPPWTTDPILQAFKFTNVYRASDRVSQFLIRNVIYSDDAYEASDVVLRVLLFKLFNRIETWQVLEQEMGPITFARFSVEPLEKILNDAFERQERIYSGAYIMPSGSRTFKAPRKHGTHLRLLDFMLKDNVAEKILSARTLQQVFELLRSYPLIGNFLAYQYAIDINYSEVTGFSESEFVAPGPGAISGLRKCFANLCCGLEADVIRLVADLQEVEFSRRNINFHWLRGRRLQLIDIQNVFCEIDKYARVRFPEAIGRLGRNRMKQLFRPRSSNINYWYPPKWAINESTPSAPGHQSKVPPPSLFFV
jgi:hypothetical protein